MNVLPTVEAMINDPQAPTAPLDDFLAAEAEDSNLWWRIGCGHHLNLFEAAVDARNLAKRGAPTPDTPEWELWLAAIDIATAAPLKQGSRSSSAQIPWTRIERLRAALLDVGVDWKWVKDPR